MISKFSVKKPYTVLVGVVLVIVLGIVSLTKMTTDLLPDMNLPYALVITTDMGASPEEVEKEVTAPIESAMAKTSNIKNISSTSYDNYSVVILEYEQTANMDSVLIEMQQKLDQLKGNWKDTIGTPMIMQLDPDMMPVIVASADVSGMSQADISDYVDQKLISSIESVEGVASVTTTGMLTENIKVVMDEEKINSLNKKIKKKILDQFESAQSELDSNSEEIKQGQSALEDGQKELASQVGSSTTEIINNKLNLIQQENELAEQLVKLQDSKEQMESAIDSLQKAYDSAVQVEQGIKELTKLKKGIPAIKQTAISQLLLVNKNATEEEKEAAANVALATVFATANEQSGLNIQSEADLDQAIDTLKQSKEKIQEGITAANKDLKEAGVEITSYKDIPNTLSVLSEQLTQINTGIESIKSGQAKIAEGKVSLDEALKTLNKMQIDSTLQMSESANQLSIAAGKITEGQTKLDEAKVTAVSSADLTNILSIDTLNNLLVAQNFSMPAGYAGKGDEQYLVRIGDEVKSFEDLQELVLIDLNMDGIDPIRLSDVANITKESNAGESYSKVNGNPAVMLSIEKQTGYSTGDVTDRVLAKFDSLTKEDSNLRISVLMNQGIYIDLIVKSVLQNMILGAILAIIVLILFLKDLKPTIVIACAIPLSVVFAIVLMYFTNISLNIISLSGLALGIGMLVDNSIVVIENIYRLRGEGYSIRKAAVEGASQVSGAIVASTLTTVCVFAPIIFTEGITRQLFVDIALTIAFTLTASLLVALTFVPMMAAGLLKNTKEIKHNFMERVQEAYGQFIQFCIRFKFLVVLVVVVLLVVSAKAAFSRGFSFMDMDMNSQQVSVTIEAKENETLTFDQLTDYSDQVMELVSKIDGIETVGAMAGSGGMMSMMGSNASSSVSMYLVLKEDTKVKSADVAKKVEELTKDLGCKVSTSSGAGGASAFMGNGISVQIKGNDLDKLQEVAAKVGDIVRNTEGTIDVKDGLDEVTPSFTIVVDKEKAAKYGQTVAQVFQLVYKEMSDRKSSTTITSNLKSYEVFVETQEQSEVTIAQLKKLTFVYTDKQGNSEEIKLKDIVEFVEGTSLNNIRRDSQNRYLNVTAGIDEDHNVTLISDKIKKEMKKIALPEGITIAMKGEDETINDAMDQLVLMLLLAIIFIYLVMVAQFQSLLSPFIIMFTIPLAFTGGLFALFFTGNEVSVVAMIGFVMLSGIIVNNGIVMVDYINQLRKEGYDKKEAIVIAGKTRLRPILMTALTTILAMSTMALGIGDGSEMMQPMAIVTIGGLLYGTLLTLVVVPCIYDMFNRNKSMVEEEL